MEPTNSKTQKKKSKIKHKTHQRCNHERAEQLTVDGTDASDEAEEEGPSVVDSDRTVDARNALKQRILRVREVILGVPEEEKEIIENPQLL